MRLGLEGRATMDKQFTGHFDTCLGCMACVTACPSGVQYDQLIEATRPQIERHTTRTVGDRWFRRLIFALFPYPNRLRFVACTLWAYQKLGIQHLLRSTGLLERLPARLKAMEGIAPSVTWRSVFGSVPGRVPAQGERRRRVGLLLGCVQRTFFPNVNDATVRVLAAEGCEVVVPAQGCCGALMMHAGLEDDAIAMAKRLVDAFEGIDVDTIVINAAGCGSTLKTYGHLLRDEPDYAERATALAAKCKDVSEVLAELSPRATRHPLSLTVAYHDACHLEHAQGVTAAPRDVLAAIPGLDVLEIPEAGLCCGSAGIYNLVEPEAARALGERKAKHVMSTGAGAVVSSNPGCLLQLQSAMNMPDGAGDGTRAALPMYHLVEVVDASIRNQPLASGQPTV
jgi:glycolate oxidase iron-sulfur subunit